MLSRAVLGALFLCGLALAAGCMDGSPEGGIGGEPAAIIGGTPDVGDPSVVFLRVRFRGGEGLCTASLIAPRVIVTAKHCICDTYTGVPVSPGNVAVGVGADVVSGTGYERVTEVRTTAGACSEDVTTLFGRDIAVLLLEAPGGLPPFPIVRDRPLAAGDRVTAIGYGVRVAGYDPSSAPASESGRKMRTTTTVAEVATTELAVNGPTTCYGDSGGPAITDDGRVAGVVSRGEGYCTGIGVYTRVDAFLELIDGAIRDTGGTEPPPPEDPPPPPPPPPPDETPDAGPPPSGGRDAGRPPVGADGGPAGDGGARRPLARDNLEGGGLVSGCSIVNLGRGSASGGGGVVWMGLGLVVLGIVGRRQRRKLKGFGA